MNIRIISFASRIKDESVLTVEISQSHQIGQFKASSNDVHVFMKSFDANKLMEIFESSLSVIQSSLWQQYVNR